MKWFKLGWFTSKDRETLKRTGEALEKIEQSTSAMAKSLASASETNGKPYKNIIFSNGNITVIFRDGTVLDKMGVDRDFFEKVRNSYSQAEIESWMIDRTAAPPVTEHTSESQEEKNLVNDNLDVLRSNKDFIVCEDSVTLKGVNLAIPTIVLSSFIEILEKQECVQKEMKEGKELDFLTIKEEDLFEQYHALKMFWLKLALNPLEQSRQDLLVFCRKNDVRITNNGNLILYRRIVSKTGADIEYVRFISQTYYSLKKKGEDTRNYAIGRHAVGKAFYHVDLREGRFDETELIGNLQHLYLELPQYETNDFTAYHDNKVSIKIGGIYSIPDSGINLNNTICAAGGLHAAAVDYNYSGFGDTAVVVLVNPSKAITVPLGETGKLRTTEMFIACVNDQPLGTHFDESALSAFDEEYHDLTLQELEDAASNKSFAAISVKENVPAVSLVDLSAIKDMLKKRIKTIV